MPIRFAFDLGTSSVGWAVYNIKDGHPSQLLGCGSRVFPDGREASAEGKTGESLTKKRRDARSPRRRRDRFIQRRTYLLNLLKETGLLPKGEKTENALSDIDPYEIRSRALTEAVDLHHFGRALFHLNQRRGFKSNRKTDTDDKDSGKIATGGQAMMKKLQESGFETLGAYLWAEHQQRNPVRFRLMGEGNNTYYDVYPMRVMHENEFDLLWERQANFHATFPDDAARDKIRHAIFHQRPLKPVKAGRCTFYPDEERLSRAHPATQERIIYEMVNKIRLSDTPGHERALTLKERDKVIDHLMTGSGMRWKAFREKIGIDSAIEINLEEGGEAELCGNPLVKILVGLTKPGPLKDHWAKYSHDQQIEIIEKLENTENTDELVTWLTGNANLEEDTARATADIRLPQGHGSLGQTATTKILAELKKDVIIYSEAAKAAGLHHSDLRDGEFFDQLPKYNTISSLQRHIGYGTGDENDPDDIRYGRIANPTVHVGLNQLRRVINAMVKKYGHPDQIVLELSRDLKQSQKQKDEYAKRNRINRAANERRRKEMLEAGKIQEGDRKIREYLIRMRLWEELGRFGDRKCPYSGEMISLNQLLSDAVEIEHILPRSRTVDDSLANKTVAFREMNRLKRDKSPSEAADIHPNTINKEEMLARTRTMPPNKRWRFLDDAMDRFKDENDFLDRQLNETRHFSRISRAYVSKLKPGTAEQKEMQVWVTTGRLTAELRRKWGLHLPGHNQKTRDDLRHHALDACVIGVIDRSMIHRIASAAATDEKSNTGRILSDIPDPYGGFSEEVNAMLARVIVSHRPNHSKAGQLHEDTNYGLVRDNAENRAHGDLDIGNVVRRKPVEGLTPKEITQIRDPEIRVSLEQLMMEVKEDFPDKKEFTKNLAIALKQWTEDESLPAHIKGTKRVRVLKREGDIVPIKNRDTGDPYRYVVPGDNHHMDIIELENGNWHGVAISTYAVNQKSTSDTPWRDEYSNAKLIMRLHKTDMVQLFDKDGTNRIKRVVRLVPSSKQLFLVEHMETGNLQNRHADKDDPFRWDIAGIAKLKERRARKVHINEIGNFRTQHQGKV